MACSRTVCPTRGARTIDAVAGFGALAEAFGVSERTAAEVTTVVRSQTERMRSVTDGR
jgi:hypothetical protein